MIKPNSLIDFLVIYSVAAVTVDVLSKLGLLTVVLVLLSALSVWLLLTTLRKEQKDQ